MPLCFDKSDVVGIKLGGFFVKRIYFFFEKPKRTSFGFHKFVFWKGGCLVTLGQTKQRLLEKRRNHGSKYMANCRYFKKIKLF